VLNQYGNVVKSYVEDKTQELIIPSITTEQELMLHICDARYSLGWVKFSEVTSNYTVSEIPDGKEKEFCDKTKKTVDKTANTLKTEVEEDEEIPRESYIFADFSGSMTYFHLSVLENLQGISGNKYVFAKYLSKYIPGWDIGAYNIGRTTNIANALNSVYMSNDAHIYILRDLNDNCDFQIKPNEEFCGEITIIYYPVNNEVAMDFIKRLREAYPNATITGF